MPQVFGGLFNIMLWMCVAAELALAVHPCAIVLYEFHSLRLPGDALAQSPRGIVDLVTVLVVKATPS